MRWSSDMTHLLIEIRGEMDSEFEKARYKFRLWEKVASTMNSKLVNKVTAKDCDDKWRNIVATYRKNIDRVKCLGDNKVRWEYFDAMDNILKGTKYLHEDCGHSMFDHSLSSSCEVEEIINVRCVIIHVTLFFIAIFIIKCYNLFIFLALTRRWKK